MKTFGVIGDGTWGLALGQRLAESGYDVLVAGLRARRRMPKGVRYTNDLQRTLAHAERIVISVPIADVDGLIKDSAPHFRAHHRVVSTARGLTPKSHLRASEVIRRETSVRQIAVLAGAADAHALNEGEPVALVVRTAPPPVKEANGVFDSALAQYWQCATGRSNHHIELPKRFRHI